MKSLVCIAFILSFVTLSFGATYIADLNDPENPGKCTVSKTIVLLPGETAKDPASDCARIVCGQNGIASIQTCAAQGVGEGCVLKDYLDKSLAYPDCCEREIICQ